MASATSRSRLTHSHFLGPRTALPRCSGATWDLAFCLDVEVPGTRAEPAVGDSVRFPLRHLAEAPRPRASPALAAALGGQSPRDSGLGAREARGPDISLPTPCLLLAAPCWATRLAAPMHSIPWRPRRSPAALCSGEGEACRGRGQVPQPGAGVGTCADCACNPALSLAVLEARAQREGVGRGDLPVSWLPVAPAARC